MATALIKQNDISSSLIHIPFQGKPSAHSVLKVFKMSYFVAMVKANDVLLPIAPEVCLLLVDEDASFTLVFPKRKAGPHGRSFLMRAIRDDSHVAWVSQ
jgi:hypothetical protein